MLKGEYPFVVNVFLHSVVHNRCFWLQFGKDVVVESPRVGINLTSWDLELVTVHAKSVYLVDSGRGTNSMEPLQVPKVTTILASSPRLEHYHDFQVTGDAMMRCMPL